MCIEKYKEEGDYIREKICGNCKKIFSKIDSLRVHFNQKNKCTEIFKCITCDSIFDKSHQLYKHCKTEIHEKNILKSRNRFHFVINESPEQRREYEKYDNSHNELGILINMYSHSEEPLFQFSKEQLWIRIFLNNLTSTENLHNIIAEFYKLRNFNPTLPQYNNIYMTKSQVYTKKFHYFNDEKKWVTGDWNCLDRFIKNAMILLKKIYFKLRDEKKIKDIHREFYSKFFAILAVNPAKESRELLAYIRDRLIKVLVKNKNVPLITKKLQYTQQILDKDTKELSCKYPYPDSIEFFGIEYVKCTDIRAKWANSNIAYVRKSDEEIIDCSGEENTENIENTENTEIGLAEDSSTQNNK